MRPPCLLAAAALCVGCNIVYSEGGAYVALPDAGWRVDRWGYFDVYGRDVGRPDVGAIGAVGQPCEDAACPAPLVCAPRSCGPERTCVARVTICDQAYVPVCDCTGSTVLNECAARAAGGGVAYAGACDGRATDGDGGGVDGAVDAGVADAGVATDAGMDAGANRCVGTICDDGYLCCAEPTSPVYGRCQLISCATCCRRAG